MQNRTHLLQQVQEQLAQPFMFGESPFVLGAQGQSFKQV